MRQAGLSWRKPEAATGVPVHLLGTRLGGGHSSRNGNGDKPTTPWA